MPNVQGRVTERFTNRGIAGALVTVGGINTLTDGNGNFLVVNIPDGIIAVRASAPNHESALTTIQVFGNQTYPTQLVLTPIARAF